MLAFEVSSTWCLVSIHHSGKNGDQRGRSRREDHAAWCIKLDPVDQADVGEGEGAKFHVVFTKARHSTKYPLTTEWTFKSENEEGGARINVSVKGKGLSDVVLDLIRQGVDNNGDIAEHLGISRALVIKLFRKLEEAGLACKEGHRYRAGAAEKKEGPVQVNAPPIEDAVISAVKPAGRPCAWDRDAQGNLGSAAGRSRGWLGERRDLLLEEYDRRRGTAQGGASPEGCGRPRHRRAGHGELSLPL